MEPVNRYPTLDKKPDNFIPTLEYLKNGQILRKKGTILEYKPGSAQNLNYQFDGKIGNGNVFFNNKPGSAQNLN